METILDNLNNEQIEAVTSVEGYVRVIAGPGSGKTRVIAHRYAYLVNRCGISTDNILCITFTNKASNVMKKRIRTLLGSNFSGHIFTFHSLCLQILKNELYHFGFPNNISVIDNNEEEEMFNTIYKEERITKLNLKYKDFSENIKKYKLSHQEEYIQFLFKKKELECGDTLITKYLIMQRDNYSLDFNDLILITLYIFNSFNDIFKKYVSKYQYILADEFQDVSHEEFALIKVLSSINKNLFVVGDGDQTIYTWRGTKDYLFLFDQYFPNCKTIKLKVNYRSTPEIIETAESLISHNPNRIEKQMTTPNNNGNKPIVYIASNREKEASFVADEIYRLKSTGESYNSFAVLYRINRHSRFIEEALIKKNIPYQIVGNVGFYERKEIKTLLSYLKFIVSLNDIDFLNIVNTPKRGIGKVKIDFLKRNTYGKSLYETLKRYMNSNEFVGTKAKEFVTCIDRYRENIKNHLPSWMLIHLYQDSGYETFLKTQKNEDREDNVQELIQAFKKIEQSQNIDNLSDMLNSLSFVMIGEEDDKETVKLMTTHIAKGQEYKHVFVVAMYEKSFPVSKATTDVDIEEERRLAYVAITRAKKALYLTSSVGTDCYSGNIIPSRFLYDIKSNLLNFKGINPNIRCCSSIQKNNLVFEQKYNKGDKVFHPLFKEGKIVNINKEAKSYEIMFKLIGSTRNISFSYGELKLIENKGFV